MNLRSRLRTAVHALAGSHLVPLSAVQTILVRRIDWRRMELSKRDDREGITVADAVHAAVSYELEGALGEITELQVKP